MKRLLGILLAAGCLCSAAEVAMPRISVLPGGSANTEIRYSAQGSQVTGVQFDLEVPSGLTVTATAGAAATAAGKTLSTADVAGKKRYVVAGLNQTALGDGVLISLVISVGAGTPASVYPLRTSNAGAVGSAGNPITLTAVDGSVTVGTPPTLPTAGAFAHLASGGAWKTSLTLVNMTASPSPIRLRFWADDGNELILPLNSPQAGGPPSSNGSYLDWTIPALGSLVVETEAPAQGPILQGWAELQTAGDVTGFAIFRLRLPGGSENEAVVPYENRSRGSYLLPFDETTGFVTGMALANLSSTTQATVNVVLRDDAGNQIATGTIPLNPRGHMSSEVSSWVSGMAGRRGTLEFRNTAAGSIAVLGLRFNRFASFATIPVVPR
jgi:hypothetical protein